LQNETYSNILRTDYSTWLGLVGLPESRPWSGIRGGGMKGALTFRTLRVIELLLE